MSAQQGVEESVAQSDLLGVAVRDIGYCGTDGTTFGERRKWHDDHPDLGSWVPSAVDPATWAQLLAYTGWFDIVMHNSSDVFWHTVRERPSMLWLWVNTEHLTKECVFEVLSAGAKDFDKKVAWCSVYHPELYMETTKNVDLELCRTLGELSRPISLAKMGRAMFEEAANAGTESGPAEVPADGDLLGEFSSEDERDDSPRS